MQAKYDIQKIDLTQEFLDALTTLMEAECKMMREAHPKYVDCWCWGRCTITDLACSDGMTFEYGGRDDIPSDGMGLFAVLTNGN